MAIFISSIHCDSVQYLYSEQNDTNIIYFMSASSKTEAFKPFNGPFRATAII